MQTKEIRNVTVQVCGLLICSKNNGALVHNHQFIAHCSLFKRFFVDNSENVKYHQMHPRVL